jgi:hypothetical protein
MRSTKAKATATAFGGGGGGTKTLSIYFKERKLIVHFLIVAALARPAFATLHGARLESTLARDAHDVSAAVLKLGLLHAHDAFLKPEHRTRVKHLQFFTRRRNGRMPQLVVERKVAPHVHTLVDVGHSSTVEAVQYVLVLMVLYFSRKSLAIMNRLSNVFVYADFAIDFKESHVAAAVDRLDGLHRMLHPLGLLVSSVLFERLLLEHGRDHLHHFRFVVLKVVFL